MPKAQEDPYLDAGMKGWLAKAARENYGRIANYDIDDLLQEGYFCYYKCKARYVGKRNQRNKHGKRCRYLSPTQPDNVSRQHFMSLVQRSVKNRMATLAWKHGGGYEVPISSLTPSDLEVEDVWESLLPTEHETATAASLLLSAPKEIKELFQLLINDAIKLTTSLWMWDDDPKMVPLPAFRAATVHPDRKRLRVGSSRRAARETTNEYYCRLLGLPASFDIVGKVEQHFLGLN